jgi:nucleotide-binding universal stress UspA family protein
VNDRPILICYDSSPEAMRAIQAAADLFASRRAIVVDIEPFLTVSESYAAVASPLGASAFDELNTAAARERANEGAALARKAGLDAEARGELGEPIWEAIVNVADELDAAVIVMGTHALKGLQEAFEGSVSHDVVRHAGRPVLVVPPAREQHR